MFVFSKGNMLTCISEVLYFKSLWEKDLMVELADIDHSFSVLLSVSR